MKAFKIKQFGTGEEVKPTEIYVAILTAGELTEKSDIDRWSKDDREGYQRPVSEARILKGKKSVVRYLTDQMGTFPTSILLSIREQVKFTPETKIAENIVLGNLEIPENAKLWIIDGQHRVEGLKAAIRNRQVFEDYPVMASILVLPDRFDEMLFFHIVNNTAKSVPTDLAFRHLQSMVTRMPHMPDWISNYIDLRDLRKGTAATIVDILAENPESPWKGRIAYLDEDFVEPQHIIKDSTMISYIANKILTETTFHYMKVDDVSDLLIAYWSAIAELYPEAFENPKDYYLTKTAGIASLTIIFPTIYAYCATSGKVSTGGMKNLLNRLQKETPEHSDLEFRRPLNSKWWSRKSAPLIAKATSEGMFKQLANRLIEKINIGIKNG